jgi:hypothetical protein
MANNNANQNKNKTVFNKETGQVPYSKIKANVAPYLTSRIWAERVKLSAAANRANVNLSNKRPTKKMVLMALAQIMGVKYTTTGRGGGLEDAPFIPGVSAIPTIQREVWSTNASHLPVDEIRKLMDGHWGIEGLSNNISRNISPNVNRRNTNTVVGGAISSFYHPAFTQVCHGNGEWLINGFKVQKAAVIEKAATILGRTKESITNGPNFLIGAGTKGATAAEADITKITIMNWPRGNSNNYSRTRIIFTIGEDKVGAGESAQAHGKEVAQLRFIMFAIYYMWLELHEANAQAHPWSKIPVQNITLEAVFLAAGASTLQNTIISNQAREERTGILVKGANGISTTKKIINVVPVNLDKFCAIFRIDAYRFAEAMTAVDAKFRKKMIEYFQEIERLNSNPSLNIKMNNSTPVNLTTGLATVKLSNQALAKRFKPVYLRGPRNAWKNNRATLENRKRWEAEWLNKYNQFATRALISRPGLKKAMQAFGGPRGNNTQSYYSGASNVGRLERNYEAMLYKRNQNLRTAAKEAAAAEAAAAEAALRAASKAAGEPPNLRMARTAFERAQIELKKKKEGSDAYRDYKRSVVNTAQARLTEAQAAYNAQVAKVPNLSNESINAIINSAIFSKAYSKFIKDHFMYRNNIKTAFNTRIAERAKNPAENPAALKSIKTAKKKING